VGALAARAWGGGYYTGAQTLVRLLRTSWRTGSALALNSTSTAQTVRITSTISYSSRRFFEHPKLASGTRLGH
jgi:hypothetical protein